MTTNRRRSNSLHGVAQFALFVTSYLPLFILIITRQLSENIKYLHWGGLNTEALRILFAKFMLSIVLMLVSVFGAWGCYMTLRNVNSLAANGYPVIVKDVNNKNSESIGYIATYIIPFLFQSFDGLYECLSVLFLLVIIYRIYINSSLLLINPVLSIWYSIYEIEYQETNSRKKGLVLTGNKYLEEEESILMYEIGHKIYFAIDN